MALIKHFSHEHMLILKNEAPKDDYGLVMGAYGYQYAYPNSVPANYGYSQGCNFFQHKTWARIPKEMNHPMLSKYPLTLFANSDDSVKIVCYGCQNPIASSGTSATYSCSQGCCFFLHKTCAELPMEINHPVHGKHPLKLFPSSPYWNSSCTCSVCRRKWKWFTYHCSLCKFDMDIRCALMEQRLEHQSHEHPLTLLYKRSVFPCDACGSMKGDEDFSYLCTTCQFWIHRSCASSPSTINHNDHYHPLTLAFSLPYVFGNFRYNCEICHKGVHPSQWVYHCAICRYVVHINCATSERDGISVEQGSELNLMHFPLPDGLWPVESDLLRQFVKAMGLRDTERPIELRHWSHDRPLHICHAQSNKREKCNACRLPISTPFYRCGHCHFFLHTNCAELPREWQHPTHKEHPLHLETISDSYEKDKCNEYNSFSLHTNYAELPREWQHPIHKKHPLDLETISDSYEKVKCNECNGFSLHTNCAELPREWQHPTHKKHPLDLETISDYYEKVKCNECNGFSLHTNCAELPREWQHPTHKKHPLHLETIGDSYEEVKCNECNGFFLHTNCAKLPREWQHSTHKKHPLHLETISDSYKKVKCNECNDFSFHTNSAELLGEWQHPTHKKYPLHLKTISDSYEKVKCNECNGFSLPTNCAKLPGEWQHLTHKKQPLHLETISDSYEKVKCNECNDFCFHTNCAELPGEWQHPTHKKYPLHLETISDSYEKVKCNECNGFSLPTNCAELPGEWQHLTHKKQPLHLETINDSYKKVKCNECKSFCSGFFYGCESCDFYLDLMCASLCTIKHEAHEHPLVPLIESRGKISSSCSACGVALWRDLKYGCDPCGYYLHNSCATLLPQTVRHRWDPHSIPLTYPPFKDHLDELYCDICEEEMHPNLWIYQCHDCDQFFHLNCILQFGGTLKVDNHPKALTFV